MRERTTSDVLREALAGLPPVAYKRAAEGQGGVRDKVFAVVDEMKGAGVKPEHVILALKGIAFEAQMGPASPILIEAMVRWCLERYFST